MDEVLEKEIEPFKVNAEDFKEPKKKGGKKGGIKGGQGTVSFVTNQKTGEKVVLKQSNKDLSKNKQDRQLFYQEVKVLATMKHPAIVKFIGWAVTPKNRGNIYLIQAEKGSLDQVIKSCRDGNPDPLWDDTHKFIISYGVAVAMKYLHSYKIIHRDLKCENILIDSNLYPYVTDFGTSKGENDVHTSQTVTQTSAKIMPPEFLDSYEKYNRKPYIDVYSYAMVLYCIWTEKEIYPGLADLQIVQLTMQDKRPEFPSSDVPSKSWRNLIEKCWSRSPEQRPTFEEIVSLFESPEFDAGNIDRALFESYKQKISTGDIGGSVESGGSNANDNSNNNDNSNSATEQTTSCISQLKKEADDGNADSQLAFALRLYNGFEIEQNRDEAKRYFELSAEKGNAESQFYLSLILAREGDSQRSAELYQKSINAGFSEAYSNYAQQLIASATSADDDKIDQSLPYLQNAIQKGSISAMNIYGNICEMNSKYGCPDIFYGMSSSCCHCLDSVGSYFPIDYKVYKCNRCNLEICEGCAKSCHKGHDLVEVGVKNAFVCGCGQNHFTDKKNKKHCSIESVGEMKCGDEPVLYQHFFRCLDCSSDQNMLICRGCAENCHNGHHVVDCGVKKGFCCCGLKKFDQNVVKCKSSWFVEFDDDKCSCSSGNYPVLQRWFQCMTCGLYGSEQQGVCASCAHRCHNGHLVLDRGVKRNKCQCMETNNCQLNNK